MTLSGSGGYSLARYLPVISALVIVTCAYVRDINNNKIII